MRNKLIKSKFLLSIIIVFFIFASLGSVLAKDIAYINRDSSNIDSSIVYLLNQGNYSYDLIYQTALDSTNFSKYKIILVGEGIFSNSSKIPVNKKNAVILNANHLDEWGWSGSGVSTKFTSVPSEIAVYDNGSSIVKGISEYFIPYNKNSAITSYEVKYISKVNDAIGLKTVVADDLSFLQLTQVYSPKNGAVVATISNGSILRGNQISKARGVFLGFTETDLWTEDVKEIFYNSIEWAIIGEDRDNDGFYSDLDCNDNNPLINPNRTEIPYDGIDQNCDGYDLADKDNDGYCKLGYAIQNKILQCHRETGSIGTDCNDENLTYNPGSTDLTKNCVNDAPVIEIISRISVYETENVSLYVNASDSENDNMTYSINDSRFVQDINDKTHFTWLTNYTDAGDYNFFVRVSDGVLYSEKKFSVRILNKNKAPELLMNISAQEWNEDTNHTLNLSQYFYDLDGDRLYYFFSQTSTDNQINLDEINNEVGGIAYFSVKKDWYGEDWIIFKVTDSLIDPVFTFTNNITLRVLPVNDAPVLLKSIGNITTNEDVVYNLDLSKYFYDVDSQLEYTFDNTTHTTLVLDGHVLRIIPQENWYGEEEEAQIKVSDGEFELTEDFIINVISVNDAPVIQSIPDKFVLAGEIVEVTASATDVEGDPFNFSMNDSRFVQADDNYFEWQTNDRDFGIYNFKVAAYDGNSYGYTNVKVNVLQKFFINEFVLGNEGWIELYNPENTSLNLSNCAISNGDSEFGLNGSLGNKRFAVFDWNALKNNGYIELSCNGVLIDRVEYTEFSNLNSLGRKTDGFNNQTGESFVLFNYPTKGVSNRADVTKPEIELNSPDNNTLFTETRDVTFNFTAIDNLAETLVCSIFANSKSLETGEFENNTQSSFFIDYLPDGIYLWNIECSDGTNNNTAKDSRIINISAPDAPTLNYIGNKVVNENSELRFYVYATDQDKDLIELYTQDLPEGANFIDNQNGNGLFSWTPNYNQSGVYNVKFFAEDITGLKDSETITILVGNTKEPPKFSDANVCENKNSSIEISIKDPKNGDDFEIGNTINGKIRIKNNLDDSRDFDYTIYLYDLNDEQVVDEYDDTISIDNGEYENVDFSIIIPSDIENKEFAIYAYVNSDEDECNSNYIEIGINRKKNDVIISEVKTDQEVVSPGDQLEVKVNTENLGRNDEDVSVLLEIPELGISQTSEKFTVEKYGDKDSDTEIFTIIIPENANEGNYEIKASVAFTGGENSKTKGFAISKANSASDGIQNNPPISLNTNSDGTPLVLGRSSGSSTPLGSGTPLKLTNDLTTPQNSNNPIVVNTPKASSSRRSLFEMKTVSLGIKEGTQKEYIPNVKVEFDGDSRNTGKFNNSSWILLAVVLGLLVIIILILILILR